MKLYVPLGRPGASEAPFGFVLQLAQDSDGRFIWNFIAFGAGCGMVQADSIIALSAVRETTTFKATGARDENSSSLPQSSIS